MSTIDAAYALPFEAQFHEGQAQQEFIYRILRSVNTARLVQVLAVHPYADGSGGLVDVQPLALNTDTNGTPLTEAPIYGMPWTRIQGGNSAFIVDPVADDIGLAVFADRDSSGVVAQKAQAVVGSARAHSEMDGVYVGGVLNQAPTQWVKLSAAGIDIKSLAALTMEAASINAQATGNIAITATGTLTLTGQGQSLVISSTGGNSTAPLTAPDFKAPNANLNTHIHSDPQGGNVGLPHN